MITFITSEDAFIGGDRDGYYRSVDCPLCGYHCRAKFMGGEQGEDLPEHFRVDCCEHVFPVERLGRASDELKYRTKWSVTYPIKPHSRGITGLGL
jgi:hypothetical protein